MSETNQDSGFSSISFSKVDIAQFNKDREAFAKRNGIPVNKVSLAMVVNVGMTYWRQRSGLEKAQDIA
jgi:hypothetical protein